MFAKALVFSSALLSFGVMAEAELEIFRCEKEAACLVIGDLEIGSVLKRDRNGREYYVGSSKADLTDVIYTGSDVCFRPNRRTNPEEIKKIVGDLLINNQYNYFSNGGHLLVRSYEMKVFEDRFTITMQLSDDYNAERTQESYVVPVCQ